MREGPGQSARLCACRTRRPGNPERCRLSSALPVFICSVPEPCFQEYKTVYSHYRILKAKIYLSVQYPGSEFQPITNYLVVGSRPFLAVARPLTEYPTYDWAPTALESELRQAKWQRFALPNTTTQVVTVGFYPYTMVGTLGPAALGRMASSSASGKAEVDTLLLGVESRQHQQLRFYRRNILRPIRSKELREY